MLGEAGSGRLLLGRGGLPGLVQGDGALVEAKVEGERLSVTAAQQQSFGERVDECLTVAVDWYGYTGCLGDGAVFADEDVQNDAVDAVIFTVEGDGAHDVVALSKTVYTSIALFMSRGIQGEVVVQDG